MPPEVSVIVPTRNRPDRLRRALTSIAGQRMPAEAIEIIVVNDGGADVTAQAREAVVNGPAVEMLTLPDRQGLPAARNAGIEHAKGEYIAFLDDDDVFLPRHLPVALAAFGNDPVDGVYTTCLVSTMPVVPPGPVVAAEAFDHSYSQEFLSVCNYIQPNSMVLRNLREVGARFDPSLPALEDWDMWLRLVRDHRFRLAHVPEATVVYHKLNDQQSMTGPTSTTASVHQRFAELHQVVWRRWAPGSPKAERYRQHVAFMDQVGLRILVDNRPLPTLYYERTVRLLRQVWNGSAREDELGDRLVHMLSEGSESSPPRIPAAEAHLPHT